MVTDPSLCPIPPGFEVIGSFNDDFDNFRNHSPYDSWKDANGNQFGFNIGVSKRWKNPNIRSVGIVCGFQFKIGPNVGERFQTVTAEDIRSIGKVTGGDVQIYFPRRHGPTNHRGSYIVKLNWYTKSDDGRIAEEYLDKEIPHDNYAGRNFFRVLNFRDQPNPRIRPDIDIRDGQWHSFLAVIYNDWHREIDPQTFQPLSTFGLFPTIGLWWSKEATTDFSKFSLLGMSADLGNFQPKDGHVQPGPMLLEIGDDDHGFIENVIIPPEIHAAIDILDGNVFGDELFEVEHPLQIRIDDVPLNEIEITNVYAASVRYNGLPPPPQGPGVCSAQAKTLIDAQAEVKKLQDEIDDIDSIISEPSEADRFPGLKTRKKMIKETLLPPFKAGLRESEFRYMRCIRNLSDFIDVSSGGTADTGGGSVGGSGNVGGGVNVGGNVGVGGGLDVH